MIVFSKTRSNQVYDYLLEQISNMTPGDNRLPSEDELAQQLGVSRATIREALKQLLRNGFIKTVHGKGTFGLPSVVHMKSRTNLGANFLTIIQTNYACADLKIEWLGFQAHGTVLPGLLPSLCQPVHVTKWNYFADGVQVIYGVSEVLQSAFAEAPVRDDSIQDVAMFGAKYLRNQLAYIAYDVKCCINEEVSRRFGIDEKTPIIYWVERYYDLADEMCGGGIYYFHPEKLSLMTTISMERINNLY